MVSRMAIIALFALAVCFTFAGCGEDESGATASTQGPPVADTLEEDAFAFWGGQKECPVCGGTPIKAEHHVNVEAGRIYFDKAECVEEFKNNKQKYLSELSQKVKRMMDPSYAPEQ